MIAKVLMVACVLVGAGFGSECGQSAEPGHEDHDHAPGEHDDHDDHDHDDHDHDEHENEE